ncbi:MAG TPA: NAD-dependent succinate-semialdehyde dehydrogenase [Dehalococcoidia bacterium]|nr:NAD-dependent succinate-semialdehyde dehydrogenase [Dehalococcoidia bacterium]
MAFQSINPATETVIATYQEFEPEQLERALQRSADTFRQWRLTSIGERSPLMKEAASILRRDKRRLARLATEEMGKPISESEAEVEKCAWNCDYYAENAGAFLAPLPRPSDAHESYVSFEPMGTVLAIMPWNFPFWQVVRFAAPALMAGNTALLKHASNVFGCAVALQDVFVTAGFPAGTFQTLVISGSTAQEVVKDPRVQAVTLTGSDLTGAKVASTAGSVIKKAVMELGGSDPFIVLPDADLQAAAQTAARARNQNTGQSCIAAKRFIIVEEVAEEFEALFVEEVAKLKVGDPMNPETQVGPLARTDLRDALESQVRRSLDLGAHLAYGGKRIDGKGYFYQPTVLTNVSHRMAAGCEETFGPVAAVLRVRDEKEAIAFANESPYGLGAAIWTGDIERAKLLARDIEAGNVFINGMVSSDPRLPFGGVKRSGYGRELSEFGIREFVNIQTVWIGPAATQGPLKAPAE